MDGGVQQPRDARRWRLPGLELCRGLRNITPGIGTFVHAPSPAKDTNDAANDEDGTDDDVGGALADNEVCVSSRRHQATNDPSAAAPAL